VVVSKIFDVHLGQMIQFDKHETQAWIGCIVSQRLGKTRSLTARLPWKMDGWQEDPFLVGWFNLFSGANLLKKLQGGGSRHVCKLVF